jgi:hypothetical protein
MEPSKSSCSELFLLKFPCAIADGAIRYAALLQALQKCLYIVIRPPELSDLCLVVTSPADITFTCRESIPAN